MRKKKTKPRGGGPLARPAAGRVTPTNCHHGSEAIAVACEERSDEAISVKQRSACPDAPNMPLFYATRDGQSRRIAARIVARLAEANLPVSLHDLASASQAPAVIAAAELVILVAAVRYGRHLPEAERFLARYHPLLAQAPLVFVSVNLTARKPGRTPPRATLIFGGRSLGMGLKPFWRPRSPDGSTIRATGGSTGRSSGSS